MRHPTDRLQHFIMYQVSILDGFGFDLGSFIHGVSNAPALAPDQHQHQHNRVLSHRTSECGTHVALGVLLHRRNKVRGRFGAFPQDFAPAARCFDIYIRYSPVILTAVLRGLVFSLSSKHARLSF